MYKLKSKKKRCDQHLYKFWKVWKTLKFDNYVCPGPENTMKNRKCHFGFFFKF